MNQPLPAFFTELVLEPVHLRSRENEVGNVAGPHGLASGLGDSRVKRREERGEREYGQGRMGKVAMFNE